jgi:signal transduction protein with GAF and PtsI domain
MSVSTEPTLEDLEQVVARALEGGGEQRFTSALQPIAGAFGAVTATLHRADSASSMLTMVAQLGLPEPLIAVTSRIPFGKGIAGLCAAQREPITLCNLQTDDSGAARPNAKQTGVAGAIAVPVFAPNGDLVGTLGVGKPGEHDYTPEEHRVLAQVANALGRALSS